MQIYNLKKRKHHHLSEWISLPLRAEKHRGDVPPQDFTAHGSSITIILVARMSWRKYHQERAARPVSPEGGYGRVCHPSILDVWVGDLVVCEAIPRASQGFRLLGCLGDVAECRDSQSPLYIYISRTGCTCYLEPATYIQRPPIYIYIRPWAINDEHVKM